MEKHKIVYFNSGFFDTDVTVIRELQKNYQVHWFVVLGPNEPYKADFFYHFVDGTGIKLALYETISRRRSIDYGKLIIKCLREISLISPQLIYTCHQDLYFPIGYYMYTRKIPLVLGIHDFDFHSSYKVPIMLKLARKISIKMATCCIFFSKNQLCSFKKSYPYKDSDYVGMSMKNFGKPSVKNAHGLKPIKLLFFGTLQPYKGCDLLIQAFEEIIDEGIKNLRLSFYGKAGSAEYLRYCKSLIKHPDFYNLHFSFVDNSDIPNIYGGHDFSVFPYRDATQSGPLMINMYYGLPIIAPSHSCFTDIYKHDINAILYDDCYSVESLKESLRRASKFDDNTYQCLLEQTKLLMKAYSEEAIANNYIRVFDETISKNKSEA